MSKPTKYQRWWMEKVAGICALERTHDGRGENEIRSWHLCSFQSLIAVNSKSVFAAYRKGWITFIRNDEYDLTPAGRKALED